MNAYLFLVIVLTTLFVAEYASIAKKAFSRWLYARQMKKKMSQPQSVKFHITPQPYSYRPVWSHPA